MKNSASEGNRPGGLPADVHADLVETLFGTVGSFISGVIGGLLVPIIAWFRTSDPIFLVCGGITLAFAIYRIMVLLAHNMESVAVRRARAHYWERVYAIGGIGFMTAVGVTSAILFELHHDELTAFYGIVIMMGCAGALAARNAGRPFIVLGQVLGVCGPLALLLLFEYDAWYWGLAAILGLVISSVKSTTRFLNATLVAALLNGREARIQRARLSTALDNMSHGLCMVDADGEIAVINHRLMEFFDLGPDAAELSVRGLAERIAACGELPPEEAGHFVDAFEHHVNQRDDSVFSACMHGRIYDFRVAPMESGGFVIVVEDVTEARLAAREVERLAHFDTLTNLPNRLQFRKSIEPILAELPRTGEQVALLSIDLDQFKEVNDTLGHPMGDRLLAAVADRLRKAVREVDLVSRFGGDEFIVMLQPAKELPDLDAFVSEMIRSLSARYFVEGHTIRIGASVGITLAPRDADNIDDLLKSADLALYQAKAAGRGTYRFFTPEMDAAMRRKRTVEQELRDAIAAGALEVHYQPVVDTKTRRVVACEALARWRHPAKGMIPPAEFIPIAEETGLIVELGDFVLRQACHDALSWPKDVRVAVNVSAKQFLLAKDLAKSILDIVADAGLEPGRLEVEITETTLMEASESLCQLTRLSQGGVRVSLDDFGTGYSSLSYFRQFPVDKIKIDRSFIKGIGDPASVAVIGSIAFLARVLDLELVMEGVETREQLEALALWDLHLVQGYLFSKPGPLAEIMPMIEEPLSPQRFPLQAVA